MIANDLLAISGIGSYDAGVTDDELWVVSDQTLPKAHKMGTPWSRAITGKFLNETVYS